MNLRHTLLLRDDETIVAIYRHHTARYLSALLLVIIFLVGPFFLLTPAATLQQTGLILVLAAFLVGLVLALRLFRLWNGSVLVVTDQRIIDVDQRSMFNHVVTEIPLARARYVSYAIDGAIGTVLGYGTVTIEGEGSSVCIAFDTVPQPAAAHRLITDLVAERHGINSNNTDHSSRVSELLAAASELEPTQARAFMLALDQAFRKGKHADEIVSSKESSKNNQRRKIKKTDRLDDVDLEQFAPDKDE